MAEIRKEMERPGSLAFWMSELPEWVRNKDEPKFVLLCQLLGAGALPSVRSTLHFDERVRRVDGQVGGHGTPCARRR